MTGGPSAPPPAPIHAAGAVLWRSDADELRVAVVHRPRYDDWSLPKGKATVGEVALLTAAREVREETGFDAAIGRTLTTVSYRVEAGPKVVHYFAARALGGEFVPNKEVDRMEWLGLPQAARRLSYEFDRAVLETFSVLPAAMPAVLLVRHARAGRRDDFAGDDADRPLDDVGVRQADALVAQLSAYAPDAVHTAPLERCHATVEPTAQALGLPIKSQPLLLEDSFKEDPSGTRRLLIELAHAETPDRCVVVCSQGGVIPGVVRALAARSDLPVGSATTPKGAFWYLCFEGRRLMQADPYPPPAV